MCIFECYWDDVYSFKLWTTYSGCSYRSYKQKLFLSFPASGLENDCICEDAVLILCGARSTLTYGSAKVHGLRWSALVLLLAPVYQIIERQACLPQNAPWVYVILSRQRPDINTINFQHVFPRLRVDSSGSGLLCECNQICRRHDDLCQELFKTVVAGDKSQKQ